MPGRFLIGFIALMLACPGVALAQTAGAPTTAASAPATAANAMPAPPVLASMAEKYFAGLKTVRARFVQTAPDGQQRMGLFYLDRPGKMRFEYDPPVRDLVVADGIQLYYFDGALQQTSSAPVSQTLADFLLRKNIHFTGDIRVLEAREGGGLWQLSVTQAADPDAGTMVLGFRPDPFSLKKWRVIDAQGQITEVELFDIELNPSLPNSLFVYRDPAHPKGKYNN